ncbi:hypothetical protein [Vibrio sp. T3Y01]|uniref:hypothetical protein n=1 Tax=Vibrio sp. T3Y01 TaxID=2607606 RepID=UPI0014937515|nr:hypothetical protein [Vibrio sp. T3Y01]NOI95782.1 hypothetical protein [Vibrio sp. T3Y01]
MANVFYIFSNGQFLGEELVYKVDQECSVRYFDYSKYSNRYIATLYLILRIILFFITGLSSKKIIHIHYPTRIIYKLIPLFSLFSNKLLITYWGSDFYKNKDLVNHFFSSINNHVDVITFTNENTSSEFVRLFEYVGKIKITRFGLSPIDYIDTYESEKVQSQVIKDIISKRKTKKSVMVGTNVSHNQQLEKLIPIINNYRNREKFFFVFCFNYGDLKLANKMKNDIGDDIDCIIIEEKLSGYDLAGLRSNTDILIQVQITDQLSGAMQETLYAGGRVVTGSWLPYSVLLDRGVHLYLVDKVDTEITNILDSMGTNNIYLQQNKSGISNLSSWNSCLDMWLDLYNG